MVYANNNMHYAKLIPIHLRDMLTLEQMYQSEKLVVHKLRRQFSAMAIVQAY